MAWVLPCGTDAGLGSSLRGVVMFRLLHLLSCLDRDGLLHKVFCSGECFQVLFP